MAKIEDLIKNIPDARLREEIAHEVAALKAAKKFGLVFERHIPEQLQLPGLPIKPGLLVVKRGGRHNEVYRVLSADGKSKFTISREPDGQEETVPGRELVVLKKFGEPIYPSLTSVNRIRCGGDKPFHALINADNFHALQLLDYCYAGLVDLIYIDPPYNTGARDWKYNNDYVDSGDQYRHSKWLAMMQRRLSIAKRLLKPDTGVLIVTVDEHEVHHLGVLLDEVFPECAKQMVSIVINQKGVAQGRLARVEEYAIYVFMPNAFLKKHHDDLLSAEPDQDEQPQGQQLLESPRWERLLRGGTGSRRADRETLFYPVFVDPERLRITGIGEPLPIEQAPDLSKIAERKVAWPLRKDGSLGRWQVSPGELGKLLEKGFVKLGGFDGKRGTWTILYLNRGTRARIDRGEIRVVGTDKRTGAVEVEYANAEARQRNIKTVWHRSSHDSGIYGSSMLRSVIGRDVDFPFPKSLYSVRDAIGAVVRDRPDALILDFFAGSGTTLHATCLLNAQDQGRRQCILVTNNEVAEKQAAELRANGHWPGHPSYEVHGICESVTWPRCKYAIAGKRDNGVSLSGEYLDGREMRMGFEENLEYFKLDFLDPDEIAYGERFEAILPILWLMAGARGERQSTADSQAWWISTTSPLAVLLDETKFARFRWELRKRPDISHVFLVTDSERAYREMIAELPGTLRTRMLYKNYLENFRINTENNL